MEAALNLTWDPNYPRGRRFREGATTGMMTQQQSGEAIEFLFFAAPELEPKPDSAPAGR